MAQQQPYQNVGRIVTKRAGATLNAYRIVKHGTDRDHVVHAAAAADEKFGVTRPGSSPDLSALVVAEDLVDVAVDGIVAVEYGGTVGVGDALTNDSVGRAIKTTTGGHRIIGFSTEAGVIGDIGAVDIQKGLY